MSTPYESSDSVRCPRCETVNELTDGDVADIAADGDRDAWCPTCDYRYLVEAKVTLVSPPLLDGAGDVPAAAEGEECG